MSKAGIIAGRAVIVVDIRDLVTKSLKGIQNQLRQFSRNVSRMAVNMTLFGGASSTGSLLLTKQFTQFEDSMLFLQSKLKTTDEVFKSVTETIRNLGRTTSFTAQEVAEGGVFLAQAGFAADEIQDMLQAVLDLARGTRTELPTAARILSNALRTYGIEAKESTKVVSQFLIATDSGTLDLVALSESMKEVQGTFKSFNVSIETSMAFITMLASRSLRGTKAGTSLNAAFLNLASSADKIKKTFNIDVADAWGNLRDPIEIMKELKTATQRMGNVKRTDLFRQLFNIRGGRTIEPIFSQIDQLALLQRRLQMASDEARRAALLMDSSWGGSVRRATSALQDLNITIQDIFTKSFKPLMDLVPGFSNAFEQLAKANERLTLAIILTPPAVLLLGVGFLIASTFASKFALILGVVNAALMGASRGVLALAGAPLNVLSQGLAAATMQGRKFDIMLGSLIPDRYVRGKKKGMPKPTSFMGKLSTKSIPIVAPLTSFFKFISGGLSQVGLLVGRLIGSVTKLAPAFTMIGTTVTRAFIGLKKFIASLSLLGPIIRFNAIKYFYMLKALKQGHWFFQLGATKTRSFALAFQYLASSGIAKATLAFRSFFAVTRSFGSAFMGAMKSFSITRIGPAVSTTLLSIGKGFLGLWNIVKRIDIVRILFTMFMTLKNIASTIAIVTGNVLRFAMSWNGLFLALNILILFGDKIPVINTSLSNLGKAFSNAFSQIGQIGKLIGPAFKLIQDGIIGLRKGQTDGFDMITRGVANIIGIIQTQLFNAWAAFVNAITDEIAFVYRTFMSIYEVIMLIVNGISQMIDGIMRLFMSTDLRGGDLGKRFRENFGEVARDSMKVLGSMIEGLFVTLVEVTRAAYAGLSGMISTVMNYFSALLTVFKVMVQQIPSYAIPGGQGVKDDLLGAINFAQALPQALQITMKASDSIVNTIADNVRLGFIEGSTAFNDRIDEIFDKDFTIEFATPPKIDILDYDQTARSIINPDQDLIDALEQPGWLDQAEQVFKSFKEGFVGATTGSFGATRNTLLKTQTLEEKQTDFMEQIANNTAQLAQNW